MAAQLFGQMREFDEEKEDWSQYVERLDQFFEANEVVTPERKRAILLTVIGPPCYKLLRSLLAPNKPNEKTYKELVDVLQDHHSPKPSEIVERFRFHSRFRQAGESVSTFVSQLRALVEHCNFGTSLEDMLRDRLVCGINDTQIQLRLLSEKDLTYSSAFTLAQSIESAAKSVKTLHGAASGITTESTGTVQLIASKDKSRFRPEWQSSSKSESDECYRCGQSGHDPSKCRYKTAKCHNCGKLGHIKPACRSQAKKPQQFDRSSREVKRLEDAPTAGDEDEEYTLFSIDSGDGRRPIEMVVHLEGVPLSMELTSQDGCLLWGNRVVIPTTCQATVLSELHEAHPGATRMKRLARTFVWWPGVDKDIEEEVRHCQECQKFQSSPPPAPLQPLKWPTRPWSRVHVDLAGPFMGHTFLILIDAHSKWMEVYPLTSTSSTNTIQCLRKFFATFGLPEVLVSDNGTNFASREFGDFLLRNGIRHNLSSPYHPASNRLAERAVQIFKRSMKKMKAGSLQDRISRFLFSYRNTPQSTTGVSPSELPMGRRPRSPLDLLKPDLHQRVEKEQAKQKEGHDSHSRSRLLSEGDAVFIRNFTQGSSETWLPGTITTQTGPLSFQITLTDGRVVRRHKDHIRKHYLRPPPDVTDEDFQPSRADTTTDETAPEDATPTNLPETESTCSEDESSPDPSPGDEPTAQPSSQRYPRRERGPPNRFGLAISH